MALKASDLVEIIDHIVKNNQHLESMGKKKNSLAIESPAGLGKTSIVEQVADTLKLDFVKLNLAQIEEVGDITGFPIREFEIRNEDGSIDWIDEKQLDQIHGSVTLTGVKRTGYCPPKWVPQGTEGGILLLDDWSRADQRILQSVMELVDRQQFISWKLPRNWHIILTSNPDDGEYFVTAMDNAQKTRFIQVKMKFDTEEWAMWAEKHGVDSRCINFLLLNPEMIKGQINARIATDFFNSISSLEDFSNERSLNIINLLGDGSVGPEFTQCFIMFIHNKLDEIPSPSWMLSYENEEHVISKIRSIVGNQKTQNYRANLASVIITRLINHIDILINEGNFRKNKKETLARIEKIITSDLFEKDIMYHLIKSLNNYNECISLLTNPTIVNQVVK